MESTGVTSASARGRIRATPSSPIRTMTAAASASPTSPLAEPSAPVISPDASPGSHAACCAGEPAAPIASAAVTVDRNGEAAKA